MTMPPRPVLGASACVWRGEEVLIAKRGKPPQRQADGGGTDPDAG